MGKAVFWVAVIIGIGYAWQKGGLKEKFDESVERLRDQRAVMASPSPSTAVQSRREFNPPEPWPQIQSPPIGAPFATPGADPCARARSNVQEMEQWMRSGGKVVEVGRSRTLSENDTFNALAQQRSYIEQNCRGR